MKDFFAEEIEGKTSTATLPKLPKKDFYSEEIGKGYFSEEVKKPSIVNTTIENIKQHPFKTILQPLPKTLGGLTPKEKLREKFLPPLETTANEPPLSPLKEGLKAFGVEMAGDIGDIAATPATYIPVPAGKMIGKIPFKGTTVGEIAKTIPIGKGFMKGAEELGRYEQTLKSIAPLTSRGITELNPVQKITQALKEAKPIRAKQEALYTAERTKRVGAVVEAGKAGGEQGYFNQLGALKGELPKVQFTGIRDKIAQPDIDSLFNTIEAHPNLLPLEKVTAKTGLAKLLGEEGGAVPTEGQLKLLGDVFPKDFIKIVTDKKPFLQKAGEGIAEVLNVPRALMASFDLSAPLRQGVFLVGRPKQWMPAFGDMFKYAFSEKAYQGLLQDIQKRPTYALMRESKLPITDIGAGLTGREEKFMSNLAEKIPVIGKIVRASDRAYTGFLDKLRADTFDDLIKSAQKQGIKVEGKVLNDISSFVGAATGRGKLGALENSAVILNSTFFSPRLMASRINLLRPDYYIKLDPMVRKEALKSLLTFGGTALSVLSLAKMGGAQVGIDPRSADFGKIKVGNTRYDIGGGFQQYIRAAAQLITGEHISSTTGVKTTVGEGYKPLTRLDIASRFIETKEAPVASFATMLLKGQTSLGKKPEIPTEIANRFTPMVIQDMQDLYKERGLEGITMGIPAIFGTGVQTYSPNASELVYSKNSVLSHVRELNKQGRFKEARKLQEQNKDIIREGYQFEGNQSIINFYNKQIDRIDKSTFYTPENKKEKILFYNQKIKELENKMEEKYKTMKGK